MKDEHLDGMEVLMKAEAEEATDVVHLEISEFGGLTKAT